MKLNNTVLTLALVGVLALAALAGGLLPMGNVVHAVAPEFADTDVRSVPENTPPGVNIGLPISATDADETGDDALEFGNTLTYSIDAASAAVFDIDSSTGQLITKAPLNHEPSEPTTYTVTVTVDDGETRDAAVTRDVTITVTDVDEPPAVPMRPTVVSGPDDDSTDANESTTSLKVVWHAPENTGPDITGYEVQYKKTTQTSFSPLTHTGTDAIATITGLDADTSYQVRVRATNGEANATENWSLVGTGSTNKGNNKPPTFIDSGTVVTRDVDENEAAGQDVGRPVRATDDGVLPLTYRLEGPDADLFDFNPSSSQIRTKRGVTYNHEDPGCGYVDEDSTTACSYLVTVVALDGAGGSDAKAVEIEVDDVPEAPGVPARITIRPTPKNSRSLDVSWNEPDNMGPPITGYDVRYRQGSSGTFTTVEATGTSVTIAPTDDDLSDGDDRLTPGASYEVYVSAKTDELDSQFSARAIGRTSSGNRQPKFNDRPDQERRRPELDDPATDTRIVNRAVNENTRTGQPIGAAVSANDRDSLSYNLIADTVDTADFSKFGINKSTGQILTKDPLNHEASTDCEYVPTDTPTVCTYKVQVEVWDGLDEHGNKEDTPVVDDTIRVTIAVEDRPEPPAAPAVTVTSPMVADGATTATLTVTWNAPENMSTVPPLTSYEVECSGAGISTTNPCPQPTGLTLTAAVQSYTIEDLTPGSPYQVRVRAVNDEGVGAWSASVRQSTSKAGNVIPTIDTAPTDLTVEENTRAGRLILSLGTPDESRVEASNTDGDGRVTYRLEGPDAAQFTIDGTGQIKTRASLNHEDAACGYVGTAIPTECSYTVRVKVSDNDGGSVFADVPIAVTDVPEPPSAPAAPRVTATKESGWSLEVTWTEPRNTGPSINDYDIRYRKVGDAAWQNWPHGTAGDDAADNTATNATISRRTSAGDAEPLEPATQYEVQVRAKNGEGDGADSPADAENWSRAGRGTTGKSNKRPVFANTASLVTLRVDENTRAGQNVGGAIEATDTDRNRLTYSLEGPGADSFTMVASSGQIRTRSALDYESRQGYSLTVKVNDGQNRDNSVAVKSVAIIVDDVDERPAAPAAPRVTGIAGSTDSVRVTWDEPANTGPPIIDYDVRCLTCPGNVFHDGADRSTIITGLTPGTRYAVEVRANNGELTGEWSRSGTGSPNPDVANQRPIFSGGTRSFEIPENASAGDPIGTPVTAVDPDLDPVTHTLEGADATSFDIDPGSGQIRVSAALDHEEKSRHSVTVKATDTRGGSATVGITINVTDIDEPPDTPSAPTVTGVSSTSVQVSWDAPENNGPPITDYDYRYSGSSGSWMEVTATTIRDTTVTIGGLTPNTFYDVQVRAKNAEGTSEWSTSGNGSTNAPGANNPPVFDEGSSATRSVSASASPGTNIGEPVTATDADSDDTVTYRLEGRDAALFDIDRANGQLRTRTGITLLVGTTYAVDVVADDTKDTARITVTIEATAAPPNNLPEFREGTSATRDVASSAPAGTAIGRPVTATDADSGDTVTYTLVGTDAASFAIDGSSGQIRTKAGVTLTGGTTYTVEVVASDTKGTASITVTINVIANSAPVFPGPFASRSVAEGQPAGTDVGGPVSAIDTDQGDTLTYTLSGPDAASFAIDGSSGQISTAVVLDYETKNSHGVVVTATDSAGQSDTIGVFISVTDVGPPAAPAAPTVTATAGSTTSLDVSWTAPSSDAAISDYDVQYRAGSTGGFTSWSHDGDGTSTVITGLTDGRSYEVQVRAQNSEGTGEWSASGMGTTTAEVVEDYGCATRGAVANASSNPGLVADCEALLRARDRLQDGGARLNWFERTRIETWEGITLSGSPQRVTEIDLNRKGLAGRIPAALGNVDRLTKLNLRSNSLTGAIPASLGDLRYLEVLNLHSNMLNGAIPDLSGTALQELYLTNNVRWNRDANGERIGRVPGTGLTGGVPAWLNDMTDLRELWLWGNNLSGTMPDLSGMRSLDKLKLNGNTGLTGFDGAKLPSGLRWLVAGETGVGATAPDLSGLTRMSTLWLNKTGLSGAIPVASIPTSVTNLNLKDNSLTTIPNMSGLVNLRYLYLHRNDLSGDIPGTMGDMASIQRIWLHENDLTGIQAGFANAADTLTHLFLAGNSFRAGTCLPGDLANVVNNDFTRAGLAACQ